MLPQIRSGTTERNGDITQLRRSRTEDNVGWVSNALQGRAGAPASQWTHVLLLGGSDTMSFRLRIAQSHLRRDMLPSFWSDCAIVGALATDIAETKLSHVPLLQPPDGRFATRTNGVVERELGEVRSAARWPNIALIALPVPHEDVMRALKRFESRSSSIDALEHVLRWLAFCWGSATRTNPLLESVGIPSACMVEAAVGAAGLDLTPGLESRASCPEAMWSAVRHFHKYYKEFRTEQPRGCYWNPHRYPISDHDGASA